MVKNRKTNSIQDWFATGNPVITPVRRINFFHSILSSTMVLLEHKEASQKWTKGKYLNHIVPKSKVWFPYSRSSGPKNLWNDWCDWSDYMESSGSLRSSQIARTNKQKAWAWQQSLGIIRIVPNVSGVFPYNRLNQFWDYWGDWDVPNNYMETRLK